MLLPLVWGGCAVGTNAPPSPGSPAAEAVEALPELIAASEATARAAAEAEGVAARLRAGELSDDQQDPWMIPPPKPTTGAPDRPADQEPARAPGKARP